MKRLRIGEIEIGPDRPTFVIAEIGVNHDGSLDRALELVDHAACAQADAVKLQIFSSKSLMHPSCGFAEYQVQQVEDTDASSMLDRYALSKGELERIVGRIIEQGMIPLATPFSPSDLGTIDELDLPAVKIASPDLVNRLLLEQVAELKRPIIVSTGAATIPEIETSVQWLRGWKARFMLMHCVSSYPTSTEEANLCWIDELQHLGVPVGYSDHTTELLSGAMAAAAGACVIEKHLTYDRNAQGPDHAASADPKQFVEYVKAIRLARTLRGQQGKHVLACEEDVRNVSRQSLVVAHDVAMGQPLRLGDLTVQRPGIGIAPAQIETAIGKVARSKLAKGTLLQWDMLSDAA